MGEEMFFDEMIGRWVTPSEYDEFISLMFEQMEQDTLKYPQYQNSVLQSEMNERLSK